MREAEAAAQRLADALENLEQTVARRRAGKESMLEQLNELEETVDKALAGLEPLMTAKEAPKNA